LGDLLVDSARAIGSERRLIENGSGRHRAENVSAQAPDVE
jgi:hypothetical protein